MGDLLEAKDAGMEALASAPKRRFSVDASDRQTSLMVLASVECDLEITAMRNSWLASGSIWPESMGPTPATPCSRWR